MATHTPALTPAIMVPDMPDTPTLPQLTHTVLRLTALTLTALLLTLTLPDIRLIHTLLDMAPTAAPTHTLPPLTPPPTVMMTANTTPANTQVPDTPDTPDTKPDTITDTTTRFGHPDSTSSLPVFTPAIECKMYKFRHLTRLSYY